MDETGAVGIPDGWDDDAPIEVGTGSTSFWDDITIHMLDVLGIDTTRGGP